MIEPSLFDQPAYEPLRPAAQTAKAVTDEAVERAGAHADADWMVAAYEAVTRCAHLRPLFTTDHVHEKLNGEPARTHERRAMGAVMRRAAAAGLIEATDQYWPSIRAEAHRNPKRVWRSLVY